MEPENQEGIVNLLKKVKDMPNKDIWLYTGYSLDGSNGNKIPQTSHTEKILDCVDVLVDGRFELQKRDLRLLFRGSANQRLIDMKQTKGNEEIIMWRN